MQWQPGYQLKNRPYRIERVLGEGGFGITYKAQHLSFDIPVVIKTPNSRLQRDSNYPKFVESFKREGKQLAKLGLNRHPHIVRVSDFFQEDNLPCIVMDFIDGKNLHDLVMARGKLSEAEAVKDIEQVASALTICHQAGIIHRDVSPLNVIVSNQTGDAILIDFGISMSLQTTRNTHSGNRSFAPWEQMAYWEQKDSRTPQVDIYALAATFYFLVTGEVPIECLARKYNSEELIEPKQLNSSLSVRINNAIKKGLEVLPENRPNSILEWLDLFVSKPVEVTTATQSQRAYQKYRKISDYSLNSTVKPEIRIKKRSLTNSNRNYNKKKWLWILGFLYPFVFSSLLSILQLIVADVHEKISMNAPIISTISLIFTLILIISFYSGFYLESLIINKKNTNLYHLLIFIGLGLLSLGIGSVPTVFYFLGVLVNRQESRMQKLSIKWQWIPLFFAFTVCIIWLLVNKNIDEYSSMGDYIFPLFIFSFSLINIGFWSGFYLESLIMNQKNKHFYHFLIITILGIPSSLIGCLPAIFYGLGIALNRKEFKMQKLSRNLDSFTKVK